MKTYPKIQTLYERDMKIGKVTDKIRLPEFENIKHWLVTEKIDGTNIRIMYTKDEMMANHITIMGRTNKAQVPVFLMEKLQQLFPIDKMKSIFSEDETQKGIEQAICLYGEGYGPRINKGGIYREKEDGVSFRLIDVWINGWWLRWEDVMSTADALDIDFVPPYGVVGLRDAINFVQADSTVAEQDKQDYGIPAEGIVARSYPLVLFRNGNPLVWKLKKRDYKEDKNVSR